MMTDEQKLECFELVNHCNTFDELIDVVKAIGALSPNGIIVGRSRDYKTDKLLLNISLIRAGFVEAQKKGEDFHYSAYNLCTREYGLRQQILYLHKYGEV